MREKPLHAQVAVALGWVLVDGVGDQWSGHPTEAHLHASGGIPKSLPRPDIDWQDAGELMEAHGVKLRRRGGLWAASSAPILGGVFAGLFPPNDQEEFIVEREAETPLRAVCELLIVLGRAGKLRSA